MANTSYVKQSLIESSTTRNLRPRSKFQILGRLRWGDVLQLDQDDMETVVPKVGKRVRVLNCPGEARRPRLCFWTHVTLDMSWLCLARSTDNNRKVSYTFGKGGYVKQFDEEEQKDFRYDEYPYCSYKLFEESV